MFSADDAARLQSLDGAADLHLVERGERPDFLGRNLGPRAKNGKHTPFLTRQRKAFRIDFGHGQRHLFGQTRQPIRKILLQIELGAGILRRTRCPISCFAQTSRHAAQSLACIPAKVFRAD
ncbi:hypothetical protein ABIE80_008582 [Bradyrhizobium diazoefficiens]